MPAQKVTTKIVVSALMGALFLSFVDKARAVDVVINEIMINPEGGDTEEWIELYSPDTNYSGTDYWLDDDNILIVDGSVQKGSNDPGSDPIQGSLLFQNSHFLVIPLSNYLNNDGDHPTLFLYKDGKEEIIDHYIYDSDPGSNITLGRWPDGGPWSPILPSATKGSPNSEPPPSPSPSPSPSSNLNPSPSPSSSSKTSSKNGIYKINEVKDENGEGLSSVLIYVDNIYIHHYTPEILTFCDGCRCNNYVDCGFGIHTIRLEKNNFNNWSETKTINLEDYYEVNPIMQPIDLSSPSPSPTPTPIIPSKSPSPIPTRLDLVGESATSSPDETTRLDLVGAESQTTESGEVLGEKKKNSFTLSLVLIGLGLGLLAATGVVFVKGNKYNKSL